MSRLNDLDFFAPLRTKCHEHIRMICAAKILPAYERANVGPEQLADECIICGRFKKKIRRQKLRSGQMARPPQLRHGPVSQVTAQNCSYGPHSSCEQ
jgi:hypothetical protein